MILRSLLLYAADQPRIRHWVTHSRATRRLSARFVAGETVEQALEAAAGVNSAGMSASLDYLGENVRNPEEARAARDVYLKLLDEIQARRLNTNVSVKLTQLGLDLSEDLCRENLAVIAERGAGYGNFLRVDMEGSPYTSRTLAMVSCVRRRFQNVGAVIQAYLYRSENDLEQLLKEKACVRLCKGAYQEPASIAFQRKSDVDRNFIRLAQVLLDDGGYHALATHDPRMIEAAREYAGRNGISPSAFEFQMLYGIRRDLQQSLRLEGWRMRVYIPFGGQWFPYLTRRLAERPANVFFVLRNLLRA